MLTPPRDYLMGDYVASRSCGCSRISLPHRTLVMLISVLSHLDLVRASSRLLALNLVLTRCRLACKPLCMIQLCSSRNPLRKRLRAREVRRGNKNENEEVRYRRPCFWPVSSRHEATHNIGQWWSSA